MDQKNRKRRQSSTHRPAHEASHDLLHAYAHTTMMGEVPEIKYPAVSRHLAECDECRADLDELLKVSQDAYTAADEPLIDLPQPNLSRLRRPWQQHKIRAHPWFIDRLGRLWLEFSEEILRAWQPSPLLGPARGTLLYTYSGKSEADSADGGQADDQALALKVDVMAEPDPRTALVRITVDLPAQNTLDQSGVPVTLYVGDTARHSATDTSCTVSFVQVPRDSLATIRLEIKVGQLA